MKYILIYYLYHLYHNIHKPDIAYYVNFLGNLATFNNTKTYIGYMQKDINYYIFYQPPNITSLGSPKINLLSALDEVRNILLLYY